MLGFFIALFGIIYWAYRIISDRAASRAVDHEIDKRRSLWEKWDSIVISDSLETYIETSMLIPENYESMKRNALEFVRSLHGLEEANFILHYNKKFSDFYVRKFVKYLELVKLGKLPSLNRIDIPSNLELAIDITPSKRARIEFCQWIEKTMRENGVGEAKIYYTRKSYDSFSWAPYVYDSTQGVPLDDPNLESIMLGMSTEETDARNAAILRSRR